ncbi:MAG: acyl carrier protein [Muribaculaceae bacterium]|nr:acyl carrier protein [Muribaculaceae bacterium]
MEKKVLEIINNIRASKELAPLAEIHVDDKLRENLGFTSFDLAELTVNIEDEYDIDIFEDGLVNTIGEIYAKLSK